jgi:hypothetical protein
MMNGELNRWSTSSNTLDAAQRRNPPPPELTEARLTAEWAFARDAAATLERVGGELETLAGALSEHDLRDTHVAAALEALNSAKAAVEVRATDLHFRRLARRHRRGR